VTRITADLQVVSQALEAYKADHGDYPRIPTYPLNAPEVPSNGAPDMPIPDAGAAVLGKALIGLYGDGVVGTTTTVDQGDPPTFQNAVAYKAGEVVRFNTPAKYWVALTDVAPSGPNFTAVPTQWTYFDPRDGNDGPGFRTQKTLDVNGDGVPDIANGKVWGPYLQADAIKVSGTFLLDHTGHPILYFPVRPAKPNLKDTTNTLGAYVGFDQNVTNNPHALVNARDNIDFFRRDSDTNVVPVPVQALARIRTMLGDYDNNGYIDDPATGRLETPIDKPYLLWSAGVDGGFGPAAVNTNTNQAAYDQNKDVEEKCDDVILKQ
jgi:hypothetical protein